MYGLRGWRELIGAEVLNPHGHCVQDRACPQADRYSTLACWAGLPDGPHAGQRGSVNSAPGQDDLYERSHPGSEHHDRK
jgi:hypothetical protein